MAYKVKTKKKETPYQRELRILEERSRGVPSLRQYYRAFQRIGYRVPQKVYVQGVVVEYKGNPHRIEKVDKNGIYLAPLVKGEKGFITKSKKRIRLSNNEVQQGAIYPYYPLALLGLA